jgi:hypothetical protein
VLEPGQFARLLLQLGVVTVPLGPHLLLGGRDGLDLALEGRIHALLAHSDFGLLCLRIRSHALELLQS